MKSRSLFTVLLSVTLIGLGVFLILSNFGIISVEISELVSKNWPLLFVIIGLKWFIGGILPGKNGSWTFGSFFIIYGLLVVLGKYDVLDFGFGDIWSLWPLLLIYIGFNSLLFAKGKGEKGKRVKIFTVGNSSSSKDYGKNHKTFVGDQNFSEENWTVEPLQMWTGVGDYYFDFTKAYIPDAETPISIKGWVGDIRMLMPEHLAFQVVASVNVGEIQVVDKKSDGLKKEVVYQTPNYEDATKKLTINLQFQVGDIRIDRV
ncbi:lia operon protein LiaF [Salirhabdus euzebyi]|uniref:Lia operon protein LiaF n=1 Tax=Salirhabdus euzebyi TaxID=394506 RepID=A0A841Q8P2_9BACI|nr:cell wall-active antibiotics response protein LiaF [Salirhabdus euzebyi]MBB6454684.1 lia operon protein LiaF [Salirhabdus euzebyi]